MAESSNGAAETVAFQRDPGWSIHRRIHAVISELGFIDKDKIHEIRKDGKKVGEFPYISHDVVTAHARSKFIKYGVMVQPTVLACANNGNRTEMTVQVDFVNIDVPGDRMTVQTVGYGVDSQDKGPGKALSYAVKYAYLKVLMLNSADDIELDDTEHAPDVPNVKMVEEEHKKRIDALQAWGHDFREAIGMAASVANLTELQKANKDAIMAAPEATREYFIELIQNRKKELENAG